VAEQTPPPEGATTTELVSQDPAPPEITAAPPSATHDPGGHEEIHMPPNSYWPLVTSIGVAASLVGVVSLDSTPLIIAIGLIVLLVGVGGWVKDARKEYSELH
jgi:hypothetical protein